MNNEQASQSKTTRHFLIPPKGSEVKVAGPQGEFSIGHDRPLTLMLGMNVIEDEETVFSCAEEISRIAKKYHCSVIFKASFDKANRSSIHSARGPGLEEGLARLSEIRERFQLPIMTDIHTEVQAHRVANCVDLLQIPAFLCRQTDLLQAACETQKPIHIKKMQLQAPHELKAIVEKCYHFGQDQLILCERGTMFGYGQLIVDPLSFVQLKMHQRPVSFDVTHALQLPGLGDPERVSSGGRSELLFSLASAGVSQGIAALFLECHPNPKLAWCDGACALPLSSLDWFVEHMLKLDQFVKAQLPLLERDNP